MHFIVTEKRYNESMLLHFSKLFLNWSALHRTQLALIGGVGITRFASGVAYGILPVIVAFSYGEEMAGIFFAVFNLYQAFLGDPLAGNLADRYGSKPVVLLGLFTTVAAALLWLAAPLSNPFVLTLFALLLFTGFSFRDEVAAYLLRTSQDHEGGLVFGIMENVYAIASFLASLSLPFFVITGNHAAGALTMLATAVAGIFIILPLSNDAAERTPSRGFWQSFNSLTLLKNGWHFIKVNGWYPVLSLGNSLFEGIFYGTIWFVIPLHLATEGVSLIEGLELGVYELITIFFAGAAGYIADRYNWRHVHALGWLLAAAGALALLVSQDVFWLIGIGAIIAIGNNLFSFAGSHALEAYDGDHAEDGTFIGLSNMVMDLGYAIGPLAAGFAYVYGGFTGSLMFAVTVTLSLGAVMTMLGYMLKEEPPVIRA